MVKRTIQYFFMVDQSKNPIADVAVDAMPSAQTTCNAKKPIQSKGQPKHQRRVTDKQEQNTDMRTECSEANALWTK